MSGRVFLWRGLIGTMCNSQGLENELIGTMCNPQGPENELVGTMCNSQGPDPHKKTTNPAVRGVSNFNPTADLQAVQ